MLNISARLFVLLAMVLITCQPAYNQVLNKQETFTHQDTLRGSLNAARTWWDVQRYDITVKPDYNNKTIAGVTGITAKVVEAGNRLQIDLQQPLVIDSIVQKIRQLAESTGQQNFISRNCPFTRDGNTAMVSVDGLVKKPGLLYLAVYYHGKPKEATRPPWDGGWIWKKDANGNPWMSVACQGLGASVWYPCKDHQSDEPDSGASLTMIVPDTLTAVGNGRLQQKQSNNDGTTSWTWTVINPINNYNIVPYIGRYSNFTEIFNGEKGALDCSYWVLDYNLDKAKKQFTQAALMLKCFEYWFGPYPFYEDGFKLVESPHLGMEHQSAVAYGNKFQNGYLGRDLSGTGWGLKWDFIIVHESGHEWFANNVSSKDLADMWIHESFTNYSETLFTDCQYGSEAGNDYVIGTRKTIANDRPVIGPYGVNREGSGDMYCKGGNMLHTIRQVINNDTIFRQLLRGLNKTFYHQTVTTQQIENYISQQSGIDFSKVFDQYLRTTMVPVLEYKISKNILQYRWTNCVPGFNLPLKITAGSAIWIKPTVSWRTQKLGKGFTGENVSIDRNFYVIAKKV
jgi:aminopeptidase N